MIMSGHESMETDESLQRFVAGAAEVVSRVTAALDRSVLEHGEIAAAKTLLNEALAVVTSPHVPAAEQLLVLRSALVRTRTTWQRLQRLDESGDAAAAHRILAQAKTIAIEAT